MGRLQGEPQLRAELEAAQSLGISHRRLSGWEPATTTIYEYDEQGRMVRSVSVPESEWDDDQRALMIALQLYRDSLCPSCGLPLEETRDPLHDRDNPEATHVYVVTGHRRCHACTALMASDEEFRNPTGDGMAAPNQPGAVAHLVELVPREAPRMSDEEIERVRAAKLAAARAKKESREGQAGRARKPRRTKE